MQRMSTCLLALMIFCPAIVVANSESNYYYSYYKEKVPLAALGGTVAIFDRDGRLEDVSGLLDHAGFPDSEIRDFPIKGWTIGLLRAASATPQITGVAWPINQLIRRTSGDRHFFSPVFAADAGNPMIISPDILIKFRHGTNSAEIQKILGKAGVAGATREAFGNMDAAYKIHTNFRSGLKVLEATNQLAAERSVIFAESDMLLTGTSSETPNDPLFGDSWHLENTGQQSSETDIDIDAMEAWMSIVGKESIITVVLDVGVQQDHPDINQIPGSDWTFDPTEEADGRPGNECDNHGTLVAGFISSIMNNGLGTVGVAPGSRVASARVGISNLECDGHFSYSPSLMVSSLAWAEEIGARVTNTSMDLPASSSSLSEKYQETRANGMIHFAAAGNKANAVSAWPARYESVISVSAINPDGTLASFSNYGESIVFSAPGFNLETTDRTGADGWRPDSDYVAVSGTSFASPIAAGVAALILSINPNLSPLEVENLMCFTASDFGEPGWDQDFGCGVVNAGQAVSALAIVFRDGFESGDTSKWSP